MRPEKIIYEDLIEKFPTILGNCSIEINEGWYGILWDLCEKLMAQNPEIYFRQVKEKFGGMRISPYRYSDSDYKLITETCQKSYQTCERCGQPGSTYGNRWVYTACEKHILSKDIEEI